MGILDLTLPDALKAWVDERIGNGRYPNASAYVVDLIRRDREKCDALVEALLEAERSGTGARTVRDIILRNTETRPDERFALSGAADRDLADLHLHTLRQYGEHKAEIYLTSLDNCFAWLAARPVRGRPVPHLREGYLRFEYAGHTVWYVIEDTSIRVMRVLPGRLDPERRN